MKSLLQSRLFIAIVISAGLSSYAAANLPRALQRQVVGITDTTTTPRLCGSPVPGGRQVDSVDGGTQIPGTNAANRRFLTICNSLENSGTPLVKCREDGVGPLMGTGNVGDVLGVGDCVPYAVSDQQNVRCVTNVQGTYVTTTECR